MPQVVGAVARREETQRRREQLTDAIEAARSRSPEHGFQFGKRLFDRIEIGTVRRQKSEMRPGGFNGELDLGLFVDGQIVEHDDIAGLQGGHQHLLDVRLKGRTVDRAIEDGRRHQALEPQAGDEGVRLPVTTRGVIVEPGAARAASIPAKQIRGDPTLVEKDVLPHVTQRLPGLPRPPGRRDVRTPLFVGVYRFF